MKYLNNITDFFNRYSKLVTNVSKGLLFMEPTENNWDSLGQPTADCPIYSYRERFDGGVNQIPIDELDLENQKEISEKLEEEFGGL